MIQDVQPQRWLAEPRTDVFLDDSGSPEGAFIRLSTGKIHRTEQPVPTEQVFLCWGFDGLPVAVKLLEPASDMTQSTIIYKLLACLNGISGSPVVDIPSSFEDSIIHLLGSASASLRSSA